jgi:hypothetical protein
MIDDIEVSHVVAVMKKSEGKRASGDDGKETARRVRGRIEAVLNAAGALGQRDLIRQNPANAKLIAYAHPSKR